MYWRHEQLDKKKMLPIIKEHRHYGFPNRRMKSVDDLQLNP